MYFAEDNLVFFQTCERQKHAADEEFKIISSLYCSVLGDEVLNYSPFYYAKHEMLNYVACVFNVSGAELYM